MYSVETSTYLIFKKLAHDYSTLPLATQLQNHVAPYGTVWQPCGKNATEIEHTLRQNSDVQCCA